MHGDLSRRPGFFRRFPRQLGRPVAAVIIHDNDGKVAGIVLLGQRNDAARDGLLFVASRNDRHHAGPTLECLWFSRVFVYLPEISAKKEQIQPDGKGDGGDERWRQRHLLLCHGFGPGDMRLRFLAGNPFSVEKMNTDFKTIFHLELKTASNSRLTTVYARSSLRMGKRRRRLPVALKMALQIAGATTGTVGSPIPVGASVLGTM